MLIRIVKEYLRPYKRWLAIIVALQLVGTIASLYLPSLNADIIDQGVVTGDTDYILRVGAVMLGISLLQIICTIVAGKMISAWPKMQSAKLTCAASRNHNLPPSVNCR